MPHSKGFAWRKEPRSGDPVPIGAVVDDLLRDEMFAQGVPIGILVRRWPDLVGEGLANATTPVALDRGILTVRAADGPWGSQARYFTEQMRERADEALGGGVVTGVRIVVARPGDEAGKRRS